MNDGIRDLLKQLPATQHGQALRVFLEEELEKIDSVDNIKTLEDAKAKQIAKTLIKAIFAFYPQGVFDKKGKTSYN